MAGESWMIFIQHPGSFEMFPTFTPADVFVASAHIPLQSVLDLIDHLLIFFSWDKYG
jgi:hypothetical protein